MIVGDTFAGLRIERLTFEVSLISGLYCDTAFVAPLAAVKV